MKHPCEVCRRVHRGRCAPTDQRSVTVTITLPGHVHRALVERVPWGERSRWIAQLLGRELEA